MSQLWQTIDLDADTGEEIFEKMIEKFDTLRSNWSGATPPADPVVGQTHVEDAGGVDEAFFYCDQGGGNAWRNIALRRLTFDLNFDPDTGEGRGASIATHQALGMRFENVGAHPTPAAGNAGMNWFYTGGSENRPYFSDGVARFGYAHVLDHATTGSLDEVPISLSGDNFLDATNPLTAVQLGDLRGFRFADAGDEILLPARVPASWRGDGSVFLRLLYWLHAGESNNDLVEFEGGFRAITPATDGAGVADPVDKTETAIAAGAATQLDIGTNTPAGSFFFQDVAIPHNDATNPLTAGDLVLVRLKMSANFGTAGYTGSVALAAASLLFRTKSRLDKA